MIGSIGEAMNRSLRTGAALYACYFVVTALEALWIGVGPRWFRAAQTWADLHPQNSAPKIALIALLGLIVAWAVDRGYRLAWYIAVVWAGVLCLGAVVLFLILNRFHDLAVSHPVESISGVVQVVCLAASLSYLCRREARAGILRS